ncbi:MAG: 3-dehydroquinate dehydratase [Clostridiales bacterium]|nr:3-dehydroquinate dehydratase [Clostridiales bacterium]
MRLMVINGPNLNKLGVRDPGQYGTKTYLDLINMIEEKETENLAINCFQSNSEGKLIDYIQLAGEEYNGIIINPGAYSHYSYAIMDALADVDIPVIEVHISDVHNREEFRKKLITSLSSDKLIVGKGFVGYIEAIDYLQELIND